MIVYKSWPKKRSNGGRTIRRWDGWFLFGIVPLYVRRVLLED